MESGVTNPGRPPECGNPSAREESGKKRDQHPATRLLVVEDDYFVAIELEYRLKVAGFHLVGLVGTAAEAIASAEAERPDLVIIRLAGPRDGIEATIEIKGRFGVSSIFASAHSDPDTKRRAQG